ncbi:MAG: cytochrome c oxidase assembly protein [Longimicrobiales bacterium]
MIRWWCAAQNTPWSWSWTAYPGVWLFILALIAGYGALRRRARRAGADSRTLARKVRYFAAGAMLLWIAIDWPLGALGAGYLAWIHMVQFLLIGMAAPPLLLLGVPAEALPALRDDGIAAHARRFVTHPLFTLLAFNVVVVATHLPVVTDSLMASQPGSFAIDTLWLGSGLLYWWPVLRPDGPRAGFAPLVQMGYLFASMIFMTAPGAMITFSEFPMYGIYELAPRIGGFPALNDQQVAGLLMKVGGGAVTWIAISIIFYRWHRDEKRIMDSELAAITDAGALARR